MTFNLLPRKSLSDVLAGRIANAITGGAYKPLSQLPSERELCEQFGVGRSTLREALKILQENELITGKQGVGWFVNELNASNLANARELAAMDLSLIPTQNPATPRDESAGPRRLPVSPEKPLLVPNLKTDRQGTFELISWWERDKVAKAKVLIVGGLSARTCWGQSATHSSQPLHSCSSTSMVPLTGIHTSCGKTE